jgi:hypothetical protein
VEQELMAAQEPRVEFLILADRAEVLNGKLYMMGGGWDQLGVADFSQAVSLGIAASILVPWLATNRQHTWGLSIETADGAPLAGVQGTFIVGRPPTIEHGTSQRAPLAMSLPLVLPAAGTYVVTASVNGNEQSRIHFRALAAPSPAMPSVA